MSLHAMKHNNCPTCRCTEKPHNVSTDESTIADPHIICGRCKDCEWRDEKRYCTNGNAIDENHGQSFNDNDDNLIYDYEELGGFQVGDNFGCVHFKQK